MRTTIHSAARDRALVLLISTLLLGACAPSEVPRAPAPKPVKTELVGGAFVEATGSFVGTLRARQRSDLGVETAGRIASISVEVGDRVRSGQVLARLDDGPARWRLNKAEADQGAAAAALIERDMQLQQQEALAREKIISTTALESARAAQRLARSQVEAADAALAAARRDLALTRITAPFDGEIVARLAQPFSDAAPGQALLQIQAGRALEVVVMLPDKVAATLVRGTKARGKTDSESVSLELERVSDRSDNGSLVQTIFRVAQASRTLRSGGMVSVELPRSAASQDGITLPLAAVMPDGKAQQASVFVLGSSGQLERRRVQTRRELLPEGRVGITAGLNRGDRVVVAGTAFLHEGQKAVEHVAQTLLHSQAEGAER